MHVTMVMNTGNQLTQAYIVTADHAEQLELLSDKFGNYFSLTIYTACSS